jgi:hypothetical protein
METLETAAELVIAINLNCHKTPSPAIHEFILNLIQIGVCIQVNDDAILIDIAGLLDRITKNRMAEAIREWGSAKFAEGMGQLHQIRFAYLVLDAGTVDSLKNIVCLLKHLHYPIQPIRLALRENMNFSANDSADLSVELFSSPQESSIMICSVIIDNLSAQFHRLDRVLDQ